MKLREGKAIDDTAFYDSISFNDPVGESVPPAEVIHLAPAA